MPERKSLQYTVLEKSLIGNEIFEEGAVVSYAGLPSRNLLPMCDEGRARAAEAVEASRAHRTKLAAELGDQAGGFGNAEAFAKAFATELAKANAELVSQVHDAVAQALSAANKPAASKKTAATAEPPIA